MRHREKLVTRTSKLLNSAAKKQIVYVKAARLPWSPFFLETHTLIASLQTGHYPPWLLCTVVVTTCSSLKAHNYIYSDTFIWNVQMK